MRNMGPSHGRRTQVPTAIEATGGRSGGSSNRRDQTIAGLFRGDVTEAICALANTGLDVIAELPLWKYNGPSLAGGTSPKIL
jgi:hypothetical protein